MYIKLVRRHVSVTVLLGFLACAMSGGNALAAIPADLKFDLNAPDVFVRSKGLSRLPADMLKVPLLRDLLSEDFLFYYDNNEGRLSLNGTIRRIVYEHDVNLLDGLVRMVFDEPADVALWRGSKGELKYFALSMTRNTLAKLLQPLAKIALDDKQLTVVATLNIDGSDVQLYSLQYAAERRLLLATRGDRLLVFSDPEMLLNTTGVLQQKAATVLVDLLSQDKKKQQRFAATFELDDQLRKHSIAVKASYLSFYYQNFFPAVKALRFDFGDKPVSGNTSNWTTAILLNGDTVRLASQLNGKMLWQAMPYQAGACMSLPVDWLAVSKTMNSEAVVGIKAEQLAKTFEGSAAVCWYPQSRLHSPLFVAQLKDVNTSDKLLEAYFNFGMRQQLQAGKEVKPAKIKKILFVAQKTKAGDMLWRNTNSVGQLQPVMARSGKLVYFSPDAVLVERALEVAHKRQPAISDKWKVDASLVNTVAMFGPDALAQLAEKEIAKSLPRQQDELLRNAADRHLLPKLAAVRKYSPMRLELGSMSKGAGWIEVNWLAY